MFDILPKQATTDIFHSVFGTSSVKMYYKPVLANGKLVNLPWQIKMLYFGVTWPLEDNPSFSVKLINFSYVFLSLSIFVLMDEGHIWFIVDNFYNVSSALEVLLTCIVLNEVTIRLFSISFTKKKYKKFLKEFFHSIYVDETTDPITWKKIRRGLLPATIYSFTYILTMSSFQILPFLFSRKNKRLLPYQVNLHYDVENAALYYMTLLFLNFTGLNVTILLIGEAFLMASFILHLNARYKILQKDIQQCSKDLISKVPKFNLAFEFRRKLVEMNKRNSNLDSFAEHLQRIHSFRIFVIIALSAVCLCILAVQVASFGSSSTPNIGYIFWITAKISDLILFGILGSTLIETTDKMSCAYYLSNWEDVISKSTNAKENCLLMKEIQIIMSLHQNPKRLTGFNFFDVSLDTVLMVLRGAFSDFTCLRTFKQSEHYYNLNNN